MPSDDGNVLRGMTTMRITFLQTGDFREAAHSFAETGQETYHAQRHSMEVVERLAQEREQASVVCIAAPEPYRERLSSGVETVGLKLYTGRRKDLGALVRAISDLRPTHVVLRFPDADVLRHCLGHGMSVLPTFADTFAPRAGIRQITDRIRHRRLARLLNDARISHVGNHNIAASESLARIGVLRSKIVPWDWPRPHRPEDHAPKAFPANRPLRLLSVGAVSEAKGVGDAIRALALTPPSEAQLTVVGKGELEAMRRLAREHGVSDRVEFRGPIPFAEVLPTMREHDALVVFTRPDYAEGLPGVLYQGLAGRLPILVSPHPVFRHYFRDGTDVAFTASAGPAALAARIGDLGRDPALYEALSRNAERTFGNILLNTDWAELVRHWLEGDHAWLDRRTLAQATAG